MMQAEPEETATYDGTTFKILKNGDIKKANHLHLATTVGMRVLRKRYETFMAFAQRSGEYQCEDEANDGCDMHVDHGMPWLSFVFEKKAMPAAVDPTARGLIDYAVKKELSFILTMDGEDHRLTILLPTKHVISDQLVAESQYLRLVRMMYEVCSHYVALALYYNGQRRHTDPVPDPRHVRYEKLDKRGGVFSFPFYNVGTSHKPHLHVKMVPSTWYAEEENISMRNRGLDLYASYNTHLEVVAVHAKVDQILAVLTRSATPSQPELLQGQVPAAPDMAEAEEMQEEDDGIEAPVQEELRYLLEGSGTIDDKLAASMVVSIGQMKAKDLIAPLTGCGSLVHLSIRRYHCKVALAMVQKMADDGLLATDAMLGMKSPLHLAVAEDRSAVIVSIIERLSTDDLEHWSTSELFSLARSQDEKIAALLSNRLPTHGALKAPAAEAGPSLELPSATPSELELPVGPQPQGVGPERL